MSSLVAQTTLPTIATSIPPLPTGTPDPRPNDDLLNQPTATTVGVPGVDTDPDTDNDGIDTDNDGDVTDNDGYDTEDDRPRGETTVPVTVTNGTVTSTRLSTSPVPTSARPSGDAGDDGDSAAGRVTVRGVLVAAVAGLVVVGMMY
ncbi:hypothetical protein EX30DRAFT_399367 [Ascodesmis nigricans]|uniref:Uncharacterized protein n=1 Tax=Ascodesmis nigricans TaxID=341454 RepID=A0A4S2MHR7_9PEZI|nr:hypothetical protein EX30DRAFT_399367 [Ascodesmis nigricans]